MENTNDRELTAPLLDPETGGLHVIEERNYTNDEGAMTGEHSEVGSQPMPSWLSERQDPLQDSPSGYQPLGMAANVGSTHYDRPPVVTKHSRAKRTTAATARAR